MLLTALRPIPGGVEALANHFDAEANDVNIVGVAQDTEHDENSQFPDNPWLTPLTTPSPLNFHIRLNLPYETNTWAGRLLGGLRAPLRHPGGEELSRRR